VAPLTAAAIAPMDSHRIVRALELHEAGELQAPSAQSQLWTRTTRRPTLLVGLTAQRDRLYEQINARVDAMLEAGVEEQVRRADAAGASETVRKALGFKDVLSGDIEGMKRHTRNYARRQLTWMRKLSGVTEVDVTDRSVEDVAAEIAGHWLR
jgi:tRNA dimethylallyltransferase